MDRIHDPRWFRAASALIDWPGVARQRLANAHVQSDEIVKRALADAKRFGERLHVAWSVRPELGVPAEPFTVWWRTVQSRTKRTSFDVATSDDRALISWGGEEVTALTVSATAFDPTRPVGLFLLREAGEDPFAAVAAAARNPGPGGAVTLEVRAPFATCALLVNGTPTNVAAAWLRDTVADDGSWNPLERVGHPVKDGELGRYRPDPQGLVVAPVGGPDAALDRLDRGGPPVGWWFSTESGRLAPVWERPDPAGLVDEARGLLFPELTRLWDDVEPQQVRLVSRRNVAGPGEGRYDAEPTTADLPLLRTLLVSAAGDAFAALTTGFATAYRGSEIDQHPAEIELLVTAPYEMTPDGDRSVELVAYLPPARHHASVPAVAGLLAQRAVLTPPPRRDDPFAESVELLWQPGLTTATLTGPTACVLAGFGPADPRASDLLPPRLKGGSAVQLLASPGGDPNHPEIPVDPRPRLVDPGRALPYEGSVSRGYAVAQANLFGIYSDWQDVAWTGTAPALMGPRVVSLSLAARWTGSTLCPAEATVEVAVPWPERTPTDVELLLVPYPMPTGATPPPAVDPDAPPAAAVTAHLGFAGDEPLVAGGPAGTGVVGVDVDGTELSRTPVPSGQVPPAVPVPRPAGTATQGDDGRRYRLTVPVGPLDFAGVSRWGVRVFARLRARNHAQPSAWSPRPEDPATAVAASPVPIVLPAPPQPPDVPLASTPDHLGRSHVRVTWVGPVPAQADRVVVWETSETVVRERLGLPEPQPGTSEALPGWRLDALWDAYDATAPDRRKNLFRRMVEVPLAGGDPHAVDVTLPRGSHDIHLFVVTTASTTGAESPWPDAAGPVQPHHHLQAALAPSLVRPTQPAVRPGFGADGALTVTFEAACSVGVTAFELFATRSAEAALDHRTMGPPRASVPAVATGGTDPITGAPLYAGAWPSDLTPSWDPWHLRATAVPPPVVGPSAVRGVVSPASEAVAVALPPTTPPDLEPLVAEVGPDGAAVLVRSATRAPDRVTAAGSHVLLATVDGVPVPPVGGAVPGPAGTPLELVPVAGSDTAPVAPATLPALARRARASGRTPLVLWTHRADPTAPLAVVLRLTDPTGRVSERTLTVAGWVPPTPATWLRIEDVFTIVGRGTVCTLSTSLPPDSAGVLRLVATRRAGGVRPVPFPTPRPLPRPLDPATSQEISLVIADVPLARRLPIGRLQAAKTPRADGGTDLSVPLTLQATTVAAQVTDPRGATASARWPTR